MEAKALAPSPVVPPTTTDKHALFRDLKEAVLRKRPILRSIIEKRGDKALLEYANQFVDVNFTPAIPTRQQELFSVLRQVTEQRFGTAISESVIRQLEKYYFVSTADHTGPLTHPFFLNADLLTAASFLTHSDPVLQNIIVLTCANISVDNHSLPRGLLYHSAQEDAPMKRMAFLSANTRPPSVYALRPYGMADLEKMKQALETDRLRKDVTNAEYEQLMGLVADIYSQPEILACSSYAEQMGKTNLPLWQKFFAASNVKLPNLINLELEDIVVKLITNFHLYQDTIINHVLFDPKYEPFINDYFEGIFGSFSREEDAGTYLFWALPKGSRHNLQLWRKGNYLVSKDESYKIELNPEAIRAAMESKELIPSLLLDFMVVSFYYGLKCLGGFNQVNYLTLMKNAYIKMNVDLGNYRSIEMCARAQTKEICDGPTVAFLGYNGDKMTLATGLDLILRGNKDSWSTFVEMCKKTTLEQALSPLMPEMYRITFEKPEWDERLLSISEKDINTLMGMDSTMRPCVHL